MLVGARGGGDRHRGRVVDRGAGISDLAVRRELIRGAALAVKAAAAGEREEHGYERPHGAGSVQAARQHGRPRRATIA